MGFTFTRFFLIFAISISFFCSCNGSDTISAGQSLFPNQTIISKEGNLELGFFSPPNSSNYYYIGIRYKNIPVQTMVWVANRNHPIHSSFYNRSRLQMNNGSLNLIVNSEIILMLARSSSATEAVILETGNFILRNDSCILWQSFDNPTDTWLPGGMVGFGSRWSTDIGAKLVSWKNMNDPATGDYSIGMEANGGSELFIKNNGSKKLWRSGILEGGKFASFPSVSEFYKFSFVTSEDSVYLTYNVYNESTLVRIVLDHLGFMKHLVWSEVKQTWMTLVVQPSDSCKIYARCGPNSVCSVDSSPVCQCLDGFVPLIERDWDVFDFSGGCRRIRPLQCDEENTRFMEVGSIRLPAYAETLEITRDGVCELVCRVNCSCTAFAYSNGGECLLFTGELLDLGSLPENAGGTLYVRTERPRKGNRVV